MTQNNTKEKSYGKSANGNFSAKGTIGVPHPYMIGTKHVVYASDHNGGRLGDDTIVSGEAQGIHCAQKNCSLAYKEHEQAILIHCSKDPKDSTELQEEAQQFLESIIPAIEKDGLAGFVLVDHFTINGTKGEK